jgi:GH25 family lysozyme M1 (1,4-beta-N-acetylmuramidase)
MRRWPERAAKEGGSDGTDRSGHLPHQQQIDLARAKPHVNFMFLKATDGTGFVDGTFATRRQKLAQLGIPRGAYHFARPGDASAQAAHFVDVVKRNGFSSRGRGDHRRGGSIG